MNNEQPQSLRELKDLIYKEYGPGGSPSPINEGRHSQAYKLDLGGTLYVVRLNGSDRAFRKDLIAFQRYGSTLPIPSIVHTGQLASGKYYCITSFVAGTPHDRLTRDLKIEVAPHLIAALDSIHAVPPSGNGCGFLDRNGNGAYESWKAYLLSNHSHPDRWSSVDLALPKDEADYLTSLNQHYVSLVPNMPEHRSFLHGDFGHNNLIVNDGGIAGILDWGDARHGDPVHDVAWLQFWETDQIDYASLYRESHPDARNFDQRLELYLIDHGLSAANFFLEQNSKNDYSYVLGLLKQKLAKIQKGRD